MALSKQQKEAYEKAYRLMLTGMFGRDRLVTTLQTYREKCAQAIIDMVLLPDITAHLEEFLNRHKEDSDA